MLLSSDVITNVVAISATVSLAYSYRYDIARKGLLGWSYLKEACQRKPFCASTLNQVDKQNVTDTVRLFHHVERVTFGYDENSKPLSNEQEHSLRTAIVNWRAYPLDGISQHISLYDILHNEYTLYQSDTNFPTSITIVYDTLLMDLTDSTIIVSTEEKNDVILKKHVSNHLIWPYYCNKSLDESTGSTCVQNVNAENEIKDQVSSPAPPSSSNPNQITSQVPSFSNITVDADRLKKTSE